MTTWLDIRQEILGMLDVNVDATTTSDVRNQVDRKLARFRDWIYRKKPPAVLFVSTSEKSILSTTTYLSILEADSGDNPGWALTDYLRPLGLVLSVESGEEGEEFDFVEWRTWLRLKSSIAGNQRLAYCYTIDYQGRIYLRDYPGAGTTWYATFHYQKTPAAITDVGEPEIELGHESIFVFGVARQFPNFFESDDKTVSLGFVEKQYQELMKEYLRDRGITKKDSRSRPAIRNRRTGSIFWGTGETS